MQQTAQAIRSDFGCEVVTVIADVRHREQVEKVVSTCIGEFGRVDVMVNNAGNTGEIGPLWQLDPERWANVISVHVLGTYYGCRSVIPGMLERATARL